MKKLMIALAAAAAITGVAKATGVNHVTNFELLGNGAEFNATMAEDGTDNGDKYWAIETGATAPYAVVTNFEGGTGTYTKDSTRALSIDTDKLLSRKVNPNSDGAESFGTAPLYFDGYVQFTAADSLPDIATNVDKLVVWLYGGDESTDGEVLTELGLTAETKSATNLVITAGNVNFNTGSVTPAHFKSSMVIEPNSWHRLTIKAIADLKLDDKLQVPGFKVFVDGNLVTANDMSAFPSMVAIGEANDLSLSSVSFKGTGAVDDLGFTNVDLFPDVEPFDYAVAVSDDLGVMGSLNYSVDGGAAEALGPVDGGTAKILPTATTVTFTATVYDGYKLVGGTKGADAGEGYFTWTLSVAVAGLAKDGTDSITLTTAEDSEGPSDWPADPREVAGTTAAEAFGITGDLAAADAGALATWATAKGVNYADRTTAILTDAFLLNCNNTAVAVAAAKEEFKVTSISVAADGTVTITPADGAKYGNGKVVVEGSAALPASWHNKTDGDYFFRVKLVVDEVPVN